LANFSEIVIVLKCSVLNITEWPSAEESMRVMVRRYIEGTSSPPKCCQNKAKTMHVESGTHTENQN
jgi:hypothetical protein